MTRRLSDSSSIMLAARVAEAYCHSRRLAYAQIAPDLTIAQAAPNFQALMAEPERRVEGRLLSDVLWEFVGADDALAAVLHGDAPRFVLDRINREQPDESVVYLTFHVFPLVEEQPGAGLLLIVEDITESGRLQQHLAQDRNELRLLQAQLHRAHEELKHLNRFKSFMLSMTAHDLRSPLATIRGYADIVLDDLVQGHSIDREHLISISFQVDRLNRMIANLLSLDRIERGQLGVNAVACDLNDLVREVAATMSVMASLRRLNLTVEAPDEPLVVLADPLLVTQVLENLVNNALKYTTIDGYIRIVTRRDGAYALVQVIDTGPGMTEEQLVSLFQLYYRTEAARQSDIAGTGLGLYIAKTLVEAQGGRIDVASRPGQGSTFEVRLPLASPSSA